MRCTRAWSTPATITIPNSVNDQTVVRITAPTATSATADWVMGGTANRGTSLDATGSYDFGSLAGSGVIAGNGSSGAAIMVVGAKNNSSTFSGSIKDNFNSTVGMALALTKVGTGTLTLSGGNTFTGATTVSNGTLLVNGSLAAGSAVAMEPMPGPAPPPAPAPG